MRFWRKEEKKGGEIPGTDNLYYVNQEVKMNFLVSFMAMLFCLIFLMLLFSKLFGEVLTFESGFLRCWYYLVGFVGGWVLHKTGGKNG